jgi:hypothetical protein
LEVSESRNEMHNTDYMVLSGSLIIRWQAHVEESSRCTGSGQLIFSA